MRLWHVPFGSSDLLDGHQVHGEESNRIVAAEPFTIVLRTVMVGPDLDRWPRGQNDVLTVTTSQFGTDPEVDRIHDYREELKACQAIGPFVGRTIYVCDDYDGRSTLWLQLRIIEVDEDLGEREALADEFSQMARTIGALFPVILPYAAAGSILAKASHNLIKVFEKNKAVIKCPITFYGPDRIGTPLQTGTFVAFSDEVDGTQFELQSDFTLKWKDDSQWTGKLSYAVFTIERTKENPVEFLVSQRVAKLLTQLDRGNVNVLKPGLDFAKDTLRGYSVFKDITRLQELESKVSRTTQEEARLVQLRQALEEYLPN